MFDYRDKYQLNREESLFLAKKKWDENIYCGMRMENRAVTFPQTKTILNGVNVPNVQLDDIQAILNMRDAWRYLFNTVDEPVTLAYMCKLNEFIARNEALQWGKLRTGTVGISGTEYMSAVPDWNTAEQELKDITGANISTTEKALNVFVWGARSQLFWDGNKRTAMTLANKLLVSAGVGILTVPDRYMGRFNEMLIEYYNTGMSEPIKRFMYENAIQGIALPNTNKDIC